MKRKFSKILGIGLTLALLTSMLLTAAPVAAATDRLVPSEYDTIQFAIDAADPGDTIIVAAGTYNPTSTLDLNKDNLVLRGEAGSKPKITTSGTSKTDYLFNISAPGVTVENFEIEKTNKENQYIIYIGADNVTIKDNLIHGQYTMGDNQVDVAMEIAAPTGLQIEGNTIHTLRQPAYINAATGDIVNNDVYNTRGWVIVSQSNLTFENNTWGDGTLPNYYDVAIIKDNPEGANNYPDIVTMSEENNNAIIENQHSKYASPILSVVHVDADASDGLNGSILDPYADISSAIPRVAPGGTVNVAAGTYVESPTVTVPLNLVGVADEGALPTLVGTLTIQSDNVLIDNMNFLVPAGITDRCADSIVLEGVDGVTISTCSFDGNESFIVGLSSTGSLVGPRAVEMKSSSSKVTIDNCTFKNGFYTAISGYVSNLTVIDSSIENCKSGINFQGGNNLVVENTDIRVIAQGEPDTYCVRFASSASENLSITGGIFTVGKAGFTPEEGNYHSAIIVRARATGTLKVEGVSIGGEVVNLSSTQQLDATNNWWGHSSGPGGEGSGLGDAVSTNVNYLPWLLTEDGDPFDKTLALNPGWSIVSPDAELASYVIVNSLDFVLTYDNGGWTEDFDLDAITPVFIKTAVDGWIGFNYATDSMGIFTTNLEAGWNLIGVPLTDAYTRDILSPLRYGQNDETALATLVSQDQYNHSGEGFYMAMTYKLDWVGLPALNKFDGYWAYMNVAKEFGVIVILDGGFK